MREHTDKFLVLPDTKVSLKNYNPTYNKGFESEEETRKHLKKDIKRLRKLQDKLYAHNKYSVLLIFQAMDAAGKDGAIKRVMSGLNPQGCQVYSFKHPSKEEYDHDYLWRHYKALPERGRIGIFNRSHYENVLITKVHPEYILSEQLPNIKTVEQIDDAFWQRRYEQIREFEQHISENGTIILKFFLHLSKKEQKVRFLERIDNPEKNWKFSYGDINERGYWDKYQAAYEQAINETSTQKAPWYIVPADNKWFTRAAIANIIAEKLETLDVKYPDLPQKEMDKLVQAKADLLSE
jgi:PPK2 family polyphosphate:nucleotide phosphotransferase